MIDKAGFEILSNLNLNNLERLYITFKSIFINHSYDSKIRTLVNKYGARIGISVCVYCGRGFKFDADKNIISKENIWCPEDHQFSFL
jgi:hypothetical protein